MEGDLVTMQDIFVFEKTRPHRGGRVPGRFRATGIRPKFYERLRPAGMHLRRSIFQTSRGDRVSTSMIAVIVSVSGHRSRWCCCRSALGMKFLELAASGRWPPCCRRSREAPVRADRAARI